ncbi:ATP-binding protein [Inediibacterium massiliense]|uniref:ATP-binding protein n=1 Tax=Inediibacterium massiliense TaxID=1658111 RepID=UPI0006B3FDC8|nr:sensor histidine kinase [Inediibacterium massiliense]
MNQFKKYILFSLSVAAFGEIYFYPFSSSLRFSAGIIALNVTILVTKEISPFLICLFSGIVVLIQRSLLDLLFYHMSLQNIFVAHGPSIIYYLIYGTFISIFHIQQRKNQLIIPIIGLAFSDILSNISETLVRHDQILYPILQIIILVGVARSIIAYLIYFFYKKQELFLLTHEHKKRYTQLNLLVSDIQAEMFYLKKSTHDIENIMKQSYNLYEASKDNKDIKDQTLNIAREIHEIKKDYYRVLHGFESFLNTFEKNDTMMLEDMFIIIRENTYRYLKTNHLHISMEFSYEENFKMHKYFHLFTILNNLIINSIDACEKYGKIQVFQKRDIDHIIFQVIDNGEGIDEDILPYIFNPGFTTKYDKNSGNPSTGIGLSHVKNIINELQGQIHVRSELKIGTTFQIILPKKILIEG